jgi:mono/diheme cytochrome c family protein
MRRVVAAVLMLIISSTVLTLPLRAEDSPGAALFRSNCIICHGSDGSGKTAIGKQNKIKDLKSPEVQKATDAEWFELISKGKKPMPPFGNRLKEDQIHQIISYLRELGTKH